MRTLVVGFLGGLLVFAFFWYRGDVQSIDLGPFGEFRPPTERPLQERLSELRTEERAVRAEFSPAQSFALPSEPSRFYAGQLIAKPRRIARAPSGSAAAFAFSTSSTVEPQARAIAEDIGAVETGFGDTILINVEYDLATASAQASGGVQSLAFNPMARVRAEAARSRDRILEDSASACTAGGGAEGQIECAIQRLRDSGGFEYVEKNHIVSHEMGAAPGPIAAAPSDPLYALQWNYQSQGDGADQSLGGGGFVDFWTRQRQRGSRDVVVAVVDTGLDLAHPDIINSDNVAPGVDMVSIPFYGNDDDGRDLDPSDPGDVCDPSDPFAENSYHGTHVAGTIGAVATNNGDGVAGAAWRVTIVPVRALGRCGGLQSDINDAIRWAAGVEPAIVESGDGGTILFENANPADIINLSLGFPAPNGCPRSTQEAINDAVEAGAIVVAAAGNASVDVAGYGPSGCENVITVAASDAVGSLTHYSNWGQGVDVMAPGGDLSRDLNEDGNPDGILSTKRSQRCRDPLTGEQVSECRYAYENGTSMAAPHVSAAFALLKSEYPDVSNDRLISLVVGGARTPRTSEQCTVPCADDGSGGPGMCLRACGQGLLDLGKAVIAQGGPVVENP